MRSRNPATESVQSLLQQNTSRTTSMNSILPSVQSKRSLVYQKSVDEIRIAQSMEKSTLRNPVEPIPRTRDRLSLPSNGSGNFQGISEFDLRKMCKGEHSATYSNTNKNQSRASNITTPDRKNEYEKLESDYNRIRDEAFNTNGVNNHIGALNASTISSSNRKANEMYHMACGRAKSRQANDTYYAEVSRCDVEQQMTYKVLLVSKQTLLQMPVEQQVIIENAIEHLAAESAIAQELVVPITSYRRLLNAPEQKIYMLHSHSVGFIGMLKVEARRLYIVDEFHRQSQRNMLCVLDFVISSQWRRAGCGKILFDKMLKYENTNAYELAYDRPSKRMIHFMAKQYMLTNAYVQPNRYVFFSAGSREKQPQPKLDVQLEAKWSNGYGRKGSSAQVLKSYNERQEHFALPPMALVSLE